MSFNRLVTYVWLWAFFWVTVLRADCPYRECECEETGIFCVQKGLRTLNLVTGRNISGYTSLSLDGNPITIIVAGTLPANLTEFDLMNNPITTIEDTALDGSASTLTDMIISNANFTRIPDAFSHLKSLKRLSIDTVHILDWNDEAMKNIGSTLETLIMQYVYFPRPPSWLQYFGRLTQLTIYGSNLNSLPDNAMSLITNSLTSLTLYGNNFTEVPKALSQLKSLQSLEMSNNKITSTNWLPSSSKLVSLALNQNRIHNATQFSNSLRPFAASLVDFGIESNELTSIPDFSFLTRVNTISFQHNKLSDSMSGSLNPNIMSLDLQYNLFSTIPRILSHLTYITDLILMSNSLRYIQGIYFPPGATSAEFAFNQITELTDTSFPENSILEELSLNNNPLNRVSGSAFNNLPRLSELNLQYTRFTRLPLALSSLVSMYHFDITGTPGLVCTCMEKSLEHWILKLGSDNVIGDCGQTSIYSFFANLSPGCPAE